MDAQTCLKKMYYVGVLAFATVDEYGAPQVRNISAVHYDENSFYFFTARGKELTKQLLRDSRIQTLAYTKYNEMIRLTGYAVPVEESRQRKCIDKIFEEQPYLANVYPDDTRYVGIIFEVKDADIEYFNLGVHPIFRESYTIGNGTIKQKGYVISDKCIGCGKCAKVCPQSCIAKGTPYQINHSHCLHCGNCFENCPVKAIQRL
ncbi:MAG: 4Fe-4S binding protein [Clostridiales bacterium]|nr:4Fe-4S binding protein [Clostridiales bacterium]